jgi:hypothetical protein
MFFEKETYKEVSEHGGMKTERLRPSSKDMINASQSRINEDITTKNGSCINLDAYLNLAREYESEV